MDVLLGVGGGEDSRIALERTLRRAQEAGDALTICPFASHDRSLASVTEQVEHAIAETELDVTIRQLESNPASQLVEIAETEDFDQLVIGGGNRSPMGKISFGPIAEFVLLNAQTSIRLER